MAQLVQFVQVAIPAPVALAELLVRPDAQYVRRTKLPHLAMETRAVVTLDLARLVVERRVLHVQQALTRPRLATQPALRVLLDILEPLVPLNVRNVLRDGGARATALVLLDALHALWVTIRRCRATWRVQCAM